MKLPHNYLRSFVQICGSAELTQGILRSFEESEGPVSAALVPWLTALKVFLITHNKRSVMDFQGVTRCQRLHRHPNCDWLNLFFLM